MEKSSFFSHLLCSHVPIKESKKLCHPKLVFLSKEKNPHVENKQLSPSPIFSTPSMLRNHQEISQAHRMHIHQVLLWFGTITCHFSCSKPTAALLPTYLIRTHTAAPGSYLNVQLTLLLLLTQLRNSKSVASKIRKFKKKKKRGR